MMTDPATAASKRTPDWQALRRAMPVAERWAYFDHAAVGPLSEPARAVLRAWADDMTENGDTNWPTWAGKLETIRGNCASLIGSDPVEIALVRNTTEGINLVAEGIPWREGDNLVTLADEFPSNQYPWLNLGSRGVECRRVEAPGGRVELADVKQACDARTRMISISWVNYAHGWRNDLDALAELARARGALLFVDAIQGLGVFPLDVRRTPVDFLAADSHKWLLGPEGAGLLYVRRQHLDLLRPLALGWNSVKHANDFTRIELIVKDSAARYEGGSYNMAGLHAMGASLELLLGYTREEMAERILATTDEACRRLTAAGATVHSHRDGCHASGIVAFDLAGRDSMQVRKQLLARGVATGCRAGKVRISPHAYTNREDLDKLIAAVEAAR